MTGNWQFAAVPGTGGTPFTSFSGYVDQVSSGSGSNFATMDVLVQASGCYAGTQSVPFKGDVEQQAVTFRSFEINGGYVDVNGTLSPDATTFTGTYQTYGSCSNATGTLTGTRYAALTGNFEGNFGGLKTEGLGLALTQNAAGTGQGTFLLTGTATVSGVPCFTSGSIANSGDAWVSGNTASLAITTNDPAGATLVLNGVFDPKAATLSLSSATVVGGACAGSLPAVQLARQS